MSIGGNFGFTPTKGKLDDGLKLINSPAEKPQDLYQWLINVSPPRKLILTYEIPSQQMSEQQPYSSEMSPQENDQLIVLHQNRPEKEEQAVQKSQYTIRKLTTPIKTSKGCRCQKSHCLKKYCDCFKIGQICGDDCSCIGCQNSMITQEHAKQIKMIQLTRSGKGGKELKCNCQKSHCLKNYCQCHSAKRVCTAACNCSDCENKIQFSGKGKRRRNFQISSWEEPKPNKQNILFN